MKPRHIAEKLGLKSQTVRNQINNIKNKIKKPPIFNNKMAFIIFITQNIKV